MRRLLVVALGLVVAGWVTAAPADDPEVPERYITVDEARTLAVRGVPLTFIDVRPPEQYQAQHIRGALSIPLRALPHRLAEVSRTVRVILY
jgi:Rhodanese-like domain